MQPGRLLLGVSQDSADITPLEKCRYDACVEVDAGFHAQGEIGVQALAGGRWLPGSGCQPDDRPCLERYGGEGADPDTGCLSCLLCVPLKPL